MNKHLAFMLVLLANAMCLSINAQIPKDSIILENDSAVALSKQDSMDVESMLQFFVKKSNIKFGLSYLSNNVYLGRKDSAVLPYINPSVGYYHKSGLFLNATLQYLHNVTDSRVDAFSLVGGYAFALKNYIGILFLGKYFYNSQSTNVKSAITSSVSYDNSFDFGFIHPTFTATLNFGNKPDYAAALGLEHTFSFFDDNLDITPSVEANASTQNYYNQYYRKRRYTIKRKRRPPITGVALITGEVENASEFKLLDYEISVPLDYTLGKFTFDLFPVYAIPVNPALLNITEKLENGTVRSRTHTEKIANTFFFTLEVLYKFR